MSAPRQRLCWAFILTPGSQNGRAGRKRDSGMILCHLVIFQMSTVTAGDLLLDTQQVSGRMSSGVLDTEISRLPVLIGSAMVRTQGSHMLGKCFPTESHSSLSPISYSVRQEKHNEPIEQIKRLRPRIRLRQSPLSHCPQGMVSIEVVL